MPAATPTAPVISRPARRGPRLSIQLHAALAVVLALAALLVGFAAVAAHASSQMWTASSYNARLVSLLNQAREKHGLHPLTPASGTTTVADRWDARIRDDKALSHNPDLISDLEHHGSPNWTFCAENVGVGDAGDPDRLFSAYMHSPEHRANILDSRAHYLGSVVDLTNGRAWNTMDFVDQYGDATPVAAHHRTHGITHHHRTRPAAPVQPAAPVHPAAPAQRAPLHSVSTHHSSPVRPAAAPHHPVRTGATKAPAHRAHPTALRPMGHHAARRPAPTTPPVTVRAALADPTASTVTGGRGMALAAGAAASLLALLACCQLAVRARTATSR